MDGRYEEGVSAANEALEEIGNLIAAGAAPIPVVGNGVMAAEIFMKASLGNSENLSKGTYATAAFTGVFLFAKPAAKGVGSFVNKSDDITRLQNAMRTVSAQNSLALIQKMRGYRGFAFNSSRAFQRYWGKAPAGYERHHIVEQSQVSRFGAQNIHNLHNMVMVPKHLNRRLAAFYSSKNELITGSDTLRVRQWVAKKSYEEQREFGLKAMNNVINGTW